MNNLENKGSFWDGFDTKQLVSQQVETKEDRNRWKDLTNKQIQQERIRIKQQQLNGTVTQDVTLPSGKQLDTRTRSKEGDLELTIKRVIKAPLIYLRFMGLSENQARIIYFSLIGVGGYFAYKKFKK